VELKSLDKDEGMLPQNRLQVQRKKERSIGHAKKTTVISKKGKVVPVLN
jgi:hypothetical protein